jgi:glycosyltransferase involved in cell wall biosynthesis
LKHIYFTVTNDLTYDQRMHRICHSLATNGYRVTLIGRKLKNSRPLEQKNFEQKRLKCLFNKGFLFYLEYNTRLFFYLLTISMDAVCAIDLDTILPCLAVSRLKSVKRIYDAHEYFTELKEVRTRPIVKRIWQQVEQFTVPKFRYGYTVSEGLAFQFAQKYKRSYTVIRNLPVLTPFKPVTREEKFLFYGGAVNEARGFEYLIPAMVQIDCKLVVAGDGNFMPQLKSLIEQYKVGHKVELKGMVSPDDLRLYAQKATLGITLAEKEGINQYLALPNKFLDYIHAALPQVAMNYPEYMRINNQYKVAILLDELSIENVARTVNEALNNHPLLEEMQHNCLLARENLYWQKEENVLINFYRTVFANE